MIFPICLQNVEGNFHRHFLSIEDINDILLLLAKGRCEMSMEISIDILLLSVNPIRICKVFSQILRVINLQKKEQFSVKRFTSGKIMVFWGTSDNTME